MEHLFTTSRYEDFSKIEEGAKALGALGFKGLSRLEGSKVFRFEGLNGL